MVKIRGYIDTDLLKQIEKKFPIETQKLTTTGLIEWAFKKLLLFTEVEKCPV